MPVHRDREATAHGELDPARIQRARRGLELGDEIRHRR